MDGTKLALARHALGLGGGRTKSYRNRYACSGPGGETFGHWKQMTDENLAEHAPPGKDQRMHFFHLTETGARAALLAGETLCREDFPHADPT